MISSLCCFIVLKFIGPWFSTNVLIDDHIWKCFFVVVVVVVMKREFWIQPAPRLRLLLSVWLCSPSIDDVSSNIVKHPRSIIDHHSNLFFPPKMRDFSKITAYCLLITIVHHFLLKIASTDFVAVVGVVEKTTWKVQNFFYRFWVVEKSTFVITLSSFESRVTISIFFLSLRIDFFRSQCLFLVFVKIIKRRFHSKKKNHFSKTKVPKKNWMDDDYDQISYFFIFFF